MKYPSAPLYAGGQPARKTGLIFVILLILAGSACLWLFWEPLRSLEFITALQARRSPVSDLFFRAFTFLGDDQFFMVFLSILLWNVNKAVGFWTAFVLLTSGMVSEIIKDVTLLPRPAIGGIVHPENSAFPSGHTLTAVTVWGYLAFRIKNNLFWFCAIITIFLIGFSRLWLAYHFPGDVLGGLVIGLAFMLVFLWASGFFDKLDLPLGVGLALAVALPVIITAVAPEGGTSKIMGYLAGASAGYLLETRFVQANPRGPFFYQVLKSLLGLAVLFAIVMGMGFMGGSTFMRFSRYALAGVWVAYLAPLVFVKTGLAARQ
jgi:membrane-associated phospholipid phosphatase